MEEKKDTKSPNPLKDGLNYLKSEFKNNHNEIRNQIDENIYGDSTPLAEAFDMAHNYFEKDKKLCDSKCTKLLIVFSDGEYNTGDPMPMVKMLKKKGVIIATCFLQKDSIRAKQLFTPEKWDRQLQPPLNEREFEHYLLQEQTTDNKVVRYYQDITANYLYTYASCVPSRINPAVGFLNSQGWDLQSDRLDLFEESGLKLYTETGQKTDIRDFLKFLFEMTNEN